MPLTFSLRGCCYDNQYNGYGEAVPKQPFVKLAKSRRFDDINDILSIHNSHLDIKTWLEDAAKSSMHIRSSINRNTQAGSGGDGYDNRPNALHLLVYYRPPLETVDRLIETLVNMRPGFVPEDCRDNKGQTALHIAVRRGCSVHVVRRLLQSSLAFPAGIIDLMKRCPLHWACCMDIPGYEGSSGSSVRSSTGTGKDGPSAEFRENMVAVVDVLVRAYPQAAVIEDVNQKTPLDLACDNRLDKRILLSLFQAAGEITHGGNHHPHYGGGSCSQYSCSGFSLPSTELMSLSSSFGSSDDGHNSSISRLIHRGFVIDGDEYDDTMSDSISSIGDGGVSVYRPEAVKHEKRNFLQF